MTVIALCLAAGSGTRMGAGPVKTLRLLHGVPVAARAVSALSRHPSVNRTWLVSPEKVGDAVAAHAANFEHCEGGRSRSDSVRAGLAAARTAGVGEDAVVLVHDAARPGLKSMVISALLEALEKHEAAAPALPVTDALKRQNGDRLETVDRNALFRVQTPQAFRLQLLERALGQSGDFVDDLAAVEALGARVRLVEGSHLLHKITYDDDLELVERLLDAEP